MTLSSHLLKLTEALKKSFPSPGLHKGILYSPYLLICYDLHKTQNQKIKSLTNPASSFHFPETVQMFSNPTHFTLSSINYNRTKINHHWLNPVQIFQTH